MITSSCVRVVFSVLSPVCCHNVPGCLTTADWPLSEILLSGRTGADRATPGTPGQSPATPVIMQSWPGYLSHTVRVTHYVDTLWPARIMFHIPSSPWSNVQKTRSDFLLWAGSDGVASTVNPTPALSHFLQNNSFHVSNFQITSVTFQISRGENIFSKMESIDRWEKGHLPCVHPLHSGNGDEINIFINHTSFYHISKNPLLFVAFLPQMKLIIHSRL